MKPHPIEPRHHLDADVTVPGSKSCTARALVMAALSDGYSALLEPADCDDSDHMMAGLEALGVPVRKSESRIEVGGRPFTAPAAPVFLGNSGTAVRFLTAACATLDGAVTLDGTQRMRERPIRDLLEALTRWGVETEAPSGCPPVTVRSRGRFGGTTRVAGSASSQYLTGLLLVAPKATEHVSIEIDGELVSKPYIDLTLAMMAERGVTVAQTGYEAFHVSAGQAYRPGTYPIEADASGASYFFAAAAVAGGRVRVRNLTDASFQGDAQFPHVLQRMGCAFEQGPDWMEVRGPGGSDNGGGGAPGVLRGVDVDLNAMPDMAQTLAVVALFADGPTTIRNVANLRIKETDRIAATATELRKLGAEVEELDDGLHITPGPLRGAAIDTYDDHRMAMSFAVAGLRVPGVVINDPACVSKTFPDFFLRFDALR
jgi:3-phosphoshikimate 1-carboxyvinyltransferase